MTDCDTGVCGADVLTLVGSVLTGTGLTLDRAVAALERGESLTLTPVQRRLVEAQALRRTGAVRHERGAVGTMSRR
jgi:hypothetical protein